MRSHKYIIKNVLFDDEEEWSGQISKYDEDGKLKMLEQRRRELQQQKEAVLNSTLESTRNALNLLKESEDIGISASIDLNRQGESLKCVNGQLDEISANLKHNHREIGGIESVFRSLRNRITGRSKRLRKSRKAAKSEPAETYKERTFENHPVTRLYGDATLVTVVTAKADVEGEIGENLEEIASHVLRLKDIGINMGQEIEAQNKLLDDIHSKVDKSEIKMKGQIKRINRLK